LIKTSKHGVSRGAPIARGNGASRESW